jgi:hypothetical protein
MSQHTPGPWHAENVGEPAYGDVYEVYNVNTHIASSLREADARLIAAAPDLLEALRNLLKHPALTGLVRGELAERVNQAHAAIAKAEGK